MAAKFEHFGGFPLRKTAWEYNSISATALSRRAVAAKKYRATLHNKEALNDPTIKTTDALDPVNADPTSAMIGRILALPATDKNATVGKKCSTQTCPANTAVISRATSPSRSAGAVSVACWFFVT